MKDSSGTVLEHTVYALDIRLDINEEAHKVETLLFYDYLVNGSGYPIHFKDRDGSLVYTRSAIFQGFEKRSAFEAQKGLHFVAAHGCEKYQKKAPSDLEGLSPIQTARKLIKTKGEAHDCQSCCFLKFCPSATGKFYAVSCAGFAKKCLDALKEEEKIDKLRECKEK